MKGKFLHISQLNKLVRGNAEFSLTFVEKSGERITAENCICSSFYSAGRTMNVKWLASGEVRKIRRCSIVEFNGQEIVL